ncbi:MAG: IS1 family transposase [Bacteroidetes bacterium]|nr:IS1 family transposase [Bacteroidota bacterium]MBT6686541.1 IS1 family transposase [Bacteroidota bacterium]MBT7142904.1 IS1 family transposase [Bacteroidota bacterium]MBT7490647.1 IS1 family transposase [Bacteroidota bacterium]
MKCLKCNCTDRVKNGFAKGLQRYKCKECGYNYTVENRSGEYSRATKRKALQLYLEGLGFRSIGRILDVSNVSILNWIRDFGDNVKGLKSDNNSIKFVDLEEVNSYIKNKNKTVGVGSLLIDLEKDSSTSLLVTS